MEASSQLSSSHPHDYNWVELRKRALSTQHRWIPLLWQKQKWSSCNLCVDSHSVIPGQQYQHHQEHAGDVPKSHLSPK